ncbi:hypothetical protein NMG60_11021485 [Bertholletia excelsa]
MESSGKKLAVLVGCNYPNTPNELHGCINDVMAMRDVLVGRFGFDPVHIEILTDAQGTSAAAMPTGANIKKVLARMVEQAVAHDLLFFHYSGHGTRIPSVRPAHRFRRDEAIVPCDFNLITDLDFRELVNRLPKGATFTILSDSCHSGGLINKEKEQIGPSSPSPSHSSSTTAGKPKTIPLESILRYLSSASGISTPDIATHLLELFGPDSSLRFRLRQPPELDLLKPDDGILLSGCQANETSADLVATEGGRKACGAFSNAVQTVLKENKGF